MANERKCVVCGKLYQFCNHCPGHQASETWKNLYDSEDCRTIFNVASNFSSGSLTAEEAKEKLTGIKIPDTLSGGVKKNIDKIFAEGKKVPAVASKEAVAEPVEKAADAAENETEEKFEEVVKPRRKQNNRIVK